MTCIVGLEFEGKVYLAGDNQGTGFNNKSIHTQPKVFEKGGAIFGFTSTYRWGQILEHCLRDVIEPADINKTYDWLVQTLVPTIMKECKASEYDEKSRNCLIGVNGQLWQLQSDWSVLRSVDGFTAAGSGYEYARGAMSYALKNHPPRTDSEVRALLDDVILVTGRNCPSVGTTATIVSK